MSDFGSDVEDSEAESEEPELTPEEKGAPRFAAAMAVPRRRRCADDASPLQLHCPCAGAGLPLDDHCVVCGCTHLHVRVFVAGTARSLQWTYHHSNPPLSFVAL